MFDSGIGGLSVLKEIQQLLPNENILYIADSAHAPYGNKSHDFILQRCHELTRFLIEQQAKAIVVACNTATAVAVSELRTTYPVPVIAMEPGVKPAIAATQSGVVGVLATENTLASEQFENLLHRYAENVQVISQPCPGLVEEIESGNFNSEKINQLIEKYTRPLLAAGADSIVLGCTHYPFIREQIQNLASDTVALIDTGQAVAQQVKRKMEPMSLKVDNNDQAWIHIWTSGEVKPLAQLANKILACETQILPLPKLDYDLNKKNGLAAVFKIRD